MARNLRQVVAILQVSTELERMGDLARSVAERARHLIDLPSIPIPLPTRRDDRTRSHDGFIPDWMPFSPRIRASLVRFAIATRKSTTIIRRSFAI